jgi:hypothetical protein
MAVVGEDVIYTRDDGGERAATIVRVKDNGLVDLLVEPDAIVDVNRPSTTVRAVAFGTGTGTCRYPGNGVSLQKVTQQITHADLTETTDATAQAINVGDPLPTDAVVLGHEVKLDTQFTGGSNSAVKMDLGGTNTVALCDQFDVKGSTASGKLYSPGYAHTTIHASHATGSYSGEQLVATFTPTGDDLAALTAGDLTITVWYTVLA